MKYVLTTIILITAICSNAQNYDSLQQKILKIDIAVNTIHQNMVKSHSEFKAGTILVIAGAILITGSETLLTDRKHLGNRSKGVILGASLTGIGSLIQFHSHRFIGRGARKKLH